MKISKRFASIAMAGVLSVGMFSVNALADETTSTEFSFTKQNDPTFTVSIPASLTITEEGTALDITASDVAYLGTSHVSVTIAGTDYYRNQLVLSGDVSKSSYLSVLRYQLISSDGATVIETTGTDTATGTELAAFTDNGTVTWTVKPVDNMLDRIEPGVTYTGTMTFGVSLAE